MWSLCVFVVEQLVLSAFFFHFGPVCTLLYTHNNYPCFFFRKTGVVRWVHDIQGALPGATNKVTRHNGRILFGCPAKRNTQSKYMHHV